MTDAHFIPEQPGPSDHQAPLIGWIGTTPNIGTTLLSYAAACQLAAEVEGKVAYLCLNLKSSKLHRYLGRTESFASLDQLRTAIRTRRLTSAQLLQAGDWMGEAGNLCVLYGNRVRAQAEYYSEADMAFLLDLARNTFTVVLVEVNAYWDNAATATVMHQSQQIMLVADNRPGSFQEDMQAGFKAGMSLLNLSTQKVELLVNATGPDGDGYGDHDIKKTSGLEVVATLPYLPQAVQAMDAGRLHTLLATDGKLARYASAVAARIIMRHQLAARTKTPQVARSWRQRLRKLWRTG